jgi:hypothetical protein
VNGSLKYRIALAIAFLSLVALLGSQPAPREQVGPLPGGAFLLNSGWRLDPVGRQVALDTLPMSTALSADGTLGQYDTAGGILMGQAVAPSLSWATRCRLVGTDSGCKFTSSSARAG